MPGSRIFLSGGGELGAPQLILQFTEGVNGFITHFPGGSNFSQGGVQMLISIETHKTITCDFPGGGSRIPPLDPTHRQRGILARIGSDEPVRPLFKLKKLQMLIGQ